MAIFDFIRKQPTNANGAAGAPVNSQNATGDRYNPPVVAGQAYGAPTGQQHTMSAVGNPVMPSYSDGAVLSQQQSYNGIGNPGSGQSYNGIGATPGGGTPYNGIGSTPSGAAPYNGIGSPPANAMYTNNIGSPVVPPMQQRVYNQQLSNSVPQQFSNSAIQSDRSSISQQAGNTGGQGVGQQTVVNNGSTPQQLNNSAIQSDRSSITQTVGNMQTQNVGQQSNQSVPPTIKPTALQSNITNEKRNELDVMTHLTQRSNKVFLEADKKAKELKNTYTDSEHLLHGLTLDGEIFKILTDLKIQPQIIQQELAKLYKKENSIAPPQISPRVKKITSDSLLIARKLGYEFISPEHLLISLVEEGEGVGARVLTKLGLQKQELYKKVTGKSESLAWNGSEASKEHAKQERTALQMYTIDLTQKATEGLLDPVVERSDVIERVVHILSRRIKNNPALIGEPGVGKTAVVEGLAQRIVAKQVPESLLGKRIMVLDLTSVVAGASHRGEFEERMKALVDELKGAKGQIIMFIDEMHTMMGAGSGDGALDASNFIKPALARGEVQLIGATTITEYRKYIEKDAALERRFQTVVVPEPSVEAAIKMLKAARDRYEAFHKVKIPDPVLELSVKLSKRYIGDRFLPDKGLDLMDEAAASVRLPLISLPEEIKSIEDQIARLKQEAQEHEAQGEKVRVRIINSKIDEATAKLNEKRDEYNMKKAQATTEVTEEIIKDIIARRTGIPISRISTSEGDRLVNLEDIIHGRMIDQERAVKAVSQAIRRGRAGLKSNNRPIGSFVFLGPTGVGKTELAKTLSEVLFDEEDAVIRFDMTEYMERHEVAKLLGPPPGYVGFEEGGKLTEAVRRKPYSLVLFDEVEKAHPDIFNILLQILDDARLTDNKGRTISFKNTVIICTSNIGTRLIQEELLKSGKNEVNEPTMVSTYVFTPRGREILSIGNKYFERDGVQIAQMNQPQATPSSSEGKQQLSDPATQPSSEANQQGQTSTTQAVWNDHMMSDYFAGQKLEGAKNEDEEKQEGEKQDKPADSEEKKTEESHKEGTEYQTAATHFPTFGYDTHAISPQGLEMITKGNIVYVRSATTAKVWNTQGLIEYFKDQIVINALPDAPDEQLPTIRLKTHTFTPDEKEIVTYKERFWRRKQNSADWETGLLKDYFAGQTVEKEAQFPVTHWDIHTFSPAGKEVVIVGNDIWWRNTTEIIWHKQTLSEYFGKDFPLEKELAEKEKVEQETDKKKYDIIKDKVMSELLKFFRPELVNRFDEVIVFEPLKFIHMISIVKLQLKGLSKLLEEQEMGFSITDSAVKQVVREGFDPIFGARPLRRAIQKQIENPISELIISKKIKIGDTLIVDYDGEEFIFNVERIERGVGKKSDEKRKTFFCEKCANRFTTDIIKNATIICSKCASRELQEVAGDVKKEVMNDKGQVQPGDLKPENKAILDKPVQTNPVAQAGAVANTNGGPTGQTPTQAPLQPVQTPQMPQQQSFPQQPQTGANDSSGTQMTSV